MAHVRVAGEGAEYRQPRPLPCLSLVGLIAPPGWRGDGPGCCYCFEGPGVGGVGLILFQGRVRGTLYWGLVGLHPSSHRESVLPTVLGNLLSWEVRHIVPGVLPGSIPKPPYLEHESLLDIIPLS